MKTKLILTFFISVLLSLNSMAQEKKVRANKKSIIDYKTELGLTDVQVEQIKTIQKEYLPKMKEARKSEDRAAIKLLNEERKSKIEQLLTPEQLEKWKVIKDKLKADLQNPELRRELRNYQKQNIRPILLEKRKAFDTELSSEEKLIIADFRAKREAFAKSAKGLSEEERMMRGKALKKEAREALSPIVEKHKPSLERINNELESSKIKWGEDIDAIKAKYNSGFKPNDERKAKPNHNIHVALRFLLLNTEK